VNWLLDNWKTLFDGVAGAALLGIIGYLLKRWIEPKGPPSGLTAQGAKVSESPVASGTGNIQRVNSPNIYINPPNAAIQKPQAAEPKTVKPPHLLSAGLTRTVPILRTKEDKFYVHHDGRPAVLARFNNEPNEAGKGKQVTAKARIVYFDDNGEELCRLNDGCWLEERLNAKRFDYDESHELMLCSVIEGVLHAFTNVRVEENIYAEEDPGSDIWPVLRFTSGTVDVRLTNKYTGEVLNHSIYTLTIDPLKATLQTAAIIPERI
jgi:hypothetical protein